MFRPLAIALSVSDVLVVLPPFSWMVSAPLALLKVSTAVRDGNDGPSADATGSATVVYRGVELLSAPVLVRATRMTDLLGRRIGPLST